MLYCTKQNSFENEIKNIDNKVDIINQNDLQSSNKQEDYQKFKHNFFNDSIFQIKRISFPLRGNSTDYIFDEENLRDTITNTYLIKEKEFYWNKVGWVFLKKINILKEDYLIDENIKSNKVNLKIKSKKDDFIIYFEFVLKDNNWYLTYYSCEWY